MLGASVAAQAGASVAINGPAFLIPSMQDDRGLSLTQAGTVAAMPIAGVMVTLFLWGLVVDRLGERFALLTGLGGTAAFSVLATTIDRTVPLCAVLFVVGMFAASTNSASGRVVVGWFPPQRRGLAMGIRQMAQPLGVAVAAATIAVTADRAGVQAALWIPVVAVALALGAVFLIVLDPPRPTATAALTANPYRADGYLMRVHGVSVLLVVPQFLVWTYSLTWLVQERRLVGSRSRCTDRGDPRARRPRPDRGWAALRHGRLPGPAAALGGGARRPDDGAAALTEPMAVAVVLMVVASTVTVADNGLAFTGVAERAGSYWSGRALGVQNTAQYLTAAAIAPVAGLAISQWGYAAAFGLAALFPVVAVGLVPREDETAP